MTTATPITTTTRAMMINPMITISDQPKGEECVKPTPADVWSRGLGSLLDRLARKMTEGGVLILDKASATALHLPTGPDDKRTQGIDDARAAGWLSGAPWAFTTFYAEGRPTIKVWVTSWDHGDPRNAMLAAGPGVTDVDLVWRMGLWHELTGTIWNGSPNTTGINLFRDNAPVFKISGKDLSPKFTLSGVPDDAVDWCELPWEPEHWSRPIETAYAHAYDASRAYLAAAQGCDLFAPWSLTHTRARTFDPKIPGMWKVKLGPWHHDLIPPPAGPGDEVRWVATPTLVLLNELAEKGEEYQTFEVLDSYTAATGKRLLRTWAETLDGAYTRAADLICPEYGEDDVAVVVRKAAKQAYTQAIGLMEKPGTVVYRPDWAMTIKAHARSIGWRKMWRIGKTEDRWPLEIKVDAIWYGSDDPDWTASKPGGLALVNAKNQADALGTFKAPKECTRERGKVTLPPATRRRSSSRVPLSERIKVAAQ